CARIGHGGEGRVRRTSRGWQRVTPDRVTRGRQRVRHRPRVDDGAGGRCRRDDDAARTAATVSEFTHLDDQGAARMVDVSAKDVSVRTATARGRVLVSAEVVRLLRDGSLPKGDALAVARIAGIMAAKRTPDL